MPDERDWLIGLTVLWFREEIKLETSLQSVGEVQKWITNLLMGGNHENCFFFNI